MEDKTFTQEEVNNIVQDRLAKEKAKYEKQLSEVQADVARREKLLDARQKLQEKGLPSELAELVKLDDDNSFNTSLELIEKTYNNQQKPDALKQGVTGAVTNYNPVSGGAVHNDPIRAAMGLR